MMTFGLLQVIRNREYTITYMADKEKLIISMEDRLKIKITTNLSSWGKSNQIGNISIE